MTDLAENSGTGLVEKKIAILEMDRRVSLSLRIVLDGLSDGYFQIVIVDEPASADMALVDLDREESVAALRALRAKNPQVQPLGLSSSNASLNGFSVLRKPISPEALLKALEMSRYSKSPAIVSPARPIDSAAEFSFYDPETLLLGSVLVAVERAKSRRCAALLRLFGDQVIAVDPDAISPVAMTNITSARLTAYATTLIDFSHRPDSSLLPAPDLRLIEREEMAKIADCKTFHLEEFLWRLGSLSSRGRLPEDFSATDRIYVSRWPGFSSLENSSVDARILAYLLPQAASPLEIARNLNLSFAEVSRVLSAAYAAGIAGLARREADELWAAAPDSAFEAMEAGGPVEQKKSLVRSIIQRIRGDR